MIGELSSNPHEAVSRVLVLYDHLGAEQLHVKDLKVRVDQKLAQLLYIGIIGEWRPPSEQKLYASSTTARNLVCVLKRRLRLCIKNAKSIAADTRGNDATHAVARSSRTRAACLAEGWRRSVRQRDRLQKGERRRLAWAHGPPACSRELHDPARPGDVVVPLLWLGRHLPCPQHKHMRPAGRAALRLAL